ncbi:dynamin family protein [Lysinibacillus sp. FSL H8-0500]|uniref:dynamin family protein n=1 Tax=Lysinibacillus sp. FSL H8-0500 TaxID=2921393 RepID=UPI003101ACBC
MDKVVQQFLGKIQDVAKQLQQFSGEIEGTEEHIKQALYELDDFTTNLTVSISQNAFGQAILESANMLKQRVHQWVTMIESHLAGKDFINQFEKSVVVTVFGNVNAGKSSLGNFIAGNHPALTQIYKKAPAFYVYDFNNGETGATLLETSEFKEGAIETTASIQYFTLLDGLTWVDTPGIHSINTQNEQLAKKYVDFADLILFLVPSSSPGKADEIEELSRLIEKQKSLLVAITKSDRSLKDEIDGKLVKVEAPKSEQDRQAQQQYLANVLKEKQVHNKIKDAQFTSLSVNLAKQALNKGDQQLFIDSGLSAFYEQIGKVLSSNAIQLKKERPIAQINATIEELVNGFEQMDGLKQIVEQLEQMTQRFSQQQANLYSEKQRIIDTLASKAKLELDVELSLLQQRFNTGQSITSNDIAKVIEKVILKHYQETVQQRLSNLIADIHVSQCNAIQIAMDVEFEKKYDTVQQQHYEVDTITRDPQGFFEHVGAFFGKQYTESKVSSYTTSKKITVGNNFADVLEQSQRELDNQVQQLVEMALKDIEDEYFTKNNHVMKVTIQQLKATVDQLQKLKISAGVMG